MYCARGRLPSLFLESSLSWQIHFSCTFSPLSFYLCGLFAFAPCCHSFRDRSPPTFYLFFLQKFSRFVLRLTDRPSCLLLHLVEPKSDFRSSTSCLFCVTLDKTITVCCLSPAVRLPRLTQLLLSLVWKTTERHTLWGGASWTARGEVLTFAVNAG